MREAAVLRAFVWEGVFGESRMLDAVQGRVQTGLRSYEVQAVLLHSMRSLSRTVHLVSNSMNSLFVLSLNTVVLGLARIMRALFHVVR